MSLFKRIDYYLELATFKLAQVIDKTKVSPSNIDPYGDRIAVSRKDEWDLTPKKYHQPAGAPNNKPIGVWYAFGTDWINLIQIEGGYAYRLKIDDSKLLKLNPSNLEDFIQSNSIEIEGKDLAHFMNIDYDDLPEDKKIAFKYYFEPKVVIDWASVATKYQGVEITGFADMGKLKYNNKFLDTWDVDSGCIWDTAAIKSVKKLGELPTFSKENDSGRSFFEGYWNEDAHGISYIFADKTGSVLGSSLELDDLQLLSAKLQQYNVHLMPDQVKNVEFFVTPSSMTLKKVPDAPSYEGKVINF